MHQIFFEIAEREWPAPPQIYLGVWICFLVCIPAYIAAMISMNYIYCGDTNWELVTSFIVRGALSEHKGTYIKPPKQLYQKGLFLLWSWMMLVLISAYQGNLLALITKPTIDIPFTDANGMVEQNQIKWGTWEGHTLFHSYAKSMHPGTTMRRIIDQAIICTDDECKDKKDFGIATISDITNLMDYMEKDFSANGSCNSYLAQDKILATDSALAFPVSEGFISNHD